MAVRMILRDGSSAYYSTIKEIGDAIAAGGTAYRPNGTPYQHRSAFGGDLLDGCPLNVVLGLPWIPGQLEALKEMGLSCVLPSSAPVSATVETCSASICGPAAGPSGPIAAALPGVLGPGTIPNAPNGDASGAVLFGNRPSGKLPGETGYVAPNLAGQGSSTGPGVDSSQKGPLIGTTFDYMAFIKGPAGIAAIILLVIVILLSQTQKGG